ncbi:MAG TPA: chemotaxis protein CheB, partial [Xanthomonadaceae bacterium]|nr:chemotaxis protein CheB [Xanthomonadaceae bacterium]
MMADPAPRVVVLGRPGEAQQQLQHALNELGAETLAVGDFDQLDPVKMREQQPDVWLVSMDESTDATRLERWQPLFDDPDATVVFDDADVTRRLSGWDLARWARHLAAKVLGREDVLPPVSPDAERLPRTQAAEEDSGASGIELSLMDDADFAALSANFDAERKQREESTEAPPAMALDDLLSAHSDDDHDAGADDAKSDAGSTAAPAPAAPSFNSDFSLLDIDADLSTPRKAAAAKPAPSIDTSGFSLEPLDETEEVQAATTTPRVAAGDASGKSAGAATHADGLIAIVAGLGGPDAVRQFLAALPTSLPVPVLLWQHLDAGKHDRLVQQLAKATMLPVYLAKEGDIAKPGAVAVMSTGLVTSSNNGLRFA